MKYPWRYHARRQGLRIGSLLLGVVFLVLAVLAAAIITFSTHYSASNPLNLKPFLPYLDDYLAGMGAKMTANRLETYYEDGNIVIQGTDLRVFGLDGDLAAVIDKGAVELSRRRLFFGIPAPKTVAAEGVTLRLVRKQEGLSIAGLEVAESEQPEGRGMGGAVEWLNSASTGLRWGALQRARVDDLTLLLRDEVQQSEWALEGGELNFSLTADGGERAVLTAELRRLYGGREIPTSPVVVVFDHAGGAPDATLRARFERSNVDMVADYFPEQIRKMFQAEGQVELGIRLEEGNRLGTPWLTLRLVDVTVTPPIGFSKPLMFKTFDVTASYQPSPTDVITVSGLRATDTSGMLVRGKGVIEGLTSGDPMVDVTLQVPEGKAQQAFNYFPDLHRPFVKPLEWLRPNIQDAPFSNLVLHYTGRPSTFPFCGVDCGLSITGRIGKGGRVRYVDELPWATLQQDGTLTLVGETLRITSPQAVSSQQRIANVAVIIGNLFSPGPNILEVDLDFAGPLGEVVEEVSKIEKPLPLAATGAHRTDFNLKLPLIKDQETRIVDATITANSGITDLNITRLDDFPGTTFTAPEATFNMRESTAQLKADGRLNGLPMNLVWQDNWRDAGVNAMQLAAKGQLDSDWLNRNGLPDMLQADGAVTVDANLKEDGATTAFQLNANAEGAALTIPQLNWSKEQGDDLTVRASGSYRRNGEGQLDALVVKGLQAIGSGVNVKGDINWQPSNLADSRLVLEPFVIGETNGAVTFTGKALTLRGQRLDVRGMDAAGAADDVMEDADLPDMTIRVDVGEMLFSSGILRDAKATVFSRNNVFDIGSFTATHNGGKVVSVREEPLPGQVGRRRLLVNVQDTGALLRTLGAYSRLLGGNLQGELNYDAPGVAGGVLTLRDFELDNPPTLVRILSLLSLEQLLSGTDKLRFSKATIPLRMEQHMVYLDKMLADGPAMSIRLDGWYNRQIEEMNFDGRLAPAIPFNRLIAKIPLIGTLLTGSQDGLVVADFKLKGPTADPQVEVRPLSVLTPGLLKDIFRGGEAPPPTPNVESNVR